MATAGKVPHREFFEIDLDGTWLPVAGYPPGFWYQELAGTLDGDAVRARLVKIDAGAFTTAAVVHDTAEIVLVFFGDLVVGCGSNGEGGKRYRAPTFAIRPADVRHGPFTSQHGCIMLEIHARA